MHQSNFWFYSIEMDLLRETYLRIHLYLGRLKASIGNQNYPIPAGTDITKYDTVLIWCRAFSILFGSTELTPSTAASA
jgi:hypothetical protein